MTHSRLFVLTLLVTLSIGTAARAQVSPDRFDRTLEQIRRETRLQAEPSIPPEQRALVEYGGYTSFGIMTYTEPTGEARILSQYDLYGYGRVSLDGAHTFFVRGRASYREFQGDNDPPGDDEWIEPNLDQGTYRFDLRRANEAYKGRSMDGNIVFEGGRQLVNWVNGLVLSQDIDGALVTLSKGPFALTVLAGVTRDDALDFDVSRPDYDDDTSRGFYGGMLSMQVSPALRPFVYGLVQQDYNDDELTTDLGAGPFTTEFEYDSYYIGVGASGAITDRLLYGVEFVYEGGRTLSNSFDTTTGAGITQTDDPISAWAADVRVDYLFTDANRSRLSGELILASGDSDRLASNATFGGNKPGTTDRGFNAMGLLNTGLAFAPSVSNLVVLRAGASTFPFASVRAFQRLQTGIDFFVFNKLDSEAPINEPTGNGGYLGFETDLYATWEIASDVALTGRYGIFLPGNTITSSGEARHFAYLGLTLSF